MHSDSRQLHLQSFPQPSMPVQGYYERPRAQVDQQSLEKAFYRLSCLTRIFVNNTKVIMVNSAGRVFDNGLAYKCNGSSKIAGQMNQNTQKMECIGVIRHNQKNLPI